MGEIRLPSRSAAPAPRLRGRRTATIDAGDIAQVPVVKDPGLKIPEGAFGGGIGEAMSGFGDALGDFGKAVARAEERQQKLFDATKTTEGLLAFERDRTDEFQKSQVDQDTAHPDWIAAGDRRLDAAKAQALAALDPRVSAEARDAYGLKLDATINGFKKAAGQISLASGENQAIDALTSINNQRSAQARRYPETTDDILRTYREDAKPFEGRTSSDQARDSLARGSRNIILAGIDGLVDQGRFREADAKLKSGEYAKDLGPEAFARATASIERGRAQAGAEIHVQSPDHFASIAETGQGIPGLRAKAASVLEPPQYDDFVARENRAQRTFGVIDSIRTAPPEEVAAKVASLKPQSGSPLFAEEARTFDEVAHAADQMMKARDANPAGYVIRTVPAVRDAYQAAQETPGLLPGVIPQLLAGQTAMGIAPENQRILPDPHGDAARIAAMPAAEVPGAIDALSQQYGKYWGQARGELVEAGLPAPSFVLGTLDEPHMAMARTELTAALTTGYTALAKSIDPQQRADIAHALDDIMSSWTQLETRRNGAGEPMAYGYAAEGRPNPAQEALRTLGFVPAQPTADPNDATASDRSDEVTTPDGGPAAASGPIEPGASQPPELVFELATNPAPREPAQVGSSQSVVGPSPPDIGSPQLTVSASQPASPPARISFGKKIGAFIDGAGSIVEDVHNAGHFVARGAGMLGEEEQARWELEGKAMDFAIGQYLNNRNVRDAINGGAAIVFKKEVRANQDGYLKWYLVGRTVTGVLLPPLGGLAFIGGTTRSVEKGHDALDAVIKGGILGRPETR